MKRLLMLSLSLFGVCLFSFGASAQQAAGGSGNSLADQFAIQAGTIAGTVQSCGQNIMEYGSRVTEAVNVLASTPQARIRAMTVYQRALANAQTAQTHMHSVNCPEAIQNFNNLPLMRPDYKQTVLPQLSQIPAIPASAQTMSSSPNASAGNAPAPTAPSTAPSLSDKANSNVNINQNIK